MKIRTWQRVWFLAYLISGILASSVTRSQSTVFDEEQAAFKQAAAFANPSVVQIEIFGSNDPGSARQAATLLTTGTIVSEDGLVVSSLSSFKQKPNSITIMLADGRRLPARWLARDLSRHLVALKFEPTEPTIPAVLSPSQEWKIGQWVIGLGKTLSTEVCSQSTGILSATGRVFDKAIQTDAKLSPQNYGGPLIDLHGRVMGIITPIEPGIATEGEVEQWYDSGIGFAIPIQDVMARVETLRQGQDIHSGKLGVRPNAADDFGGPVVLAGVTPGSPAAKAGLKSGDEITHINGKVIGRLNDMRHALGPLDAGMIASIDFKRGDETSNVRATLVKEVPAYREPYLGMLVRQSVGFNVLVEGVIAGSPAEQAAIRAGMIVETVAGQSIGAVEDLDRAIAFHDYRETIELQLRDEMAEPKEVTLSVRTTPWNGNLPKVLPAVVPRNEETGTGAGIVEIKLGDVPNSCFAYVPKNYDQTVPHGLMIALAEAGEVNRKEWIDHWEPFCRQHRWMLVVLGSANEKQWSVDEAELISRLRTQCIKDYSIDERRIVLGGQGSGGTLAFLVALRDRAKTRGAWVIDAKLPLGMRLPDPEPQETLHLMMIGDRPEWEAFEKIADKLGYPTTRFSKAVDLKDASKTEYLETLQLWLRRLECF